MPRRERALIASRELLARLEEQAWPGNVREFGNFVRRAVALSRGGEIGVEAFDHGKALSRRTVGALPAAGRRSGSRVYRSAKWSASFLP